MDRVTLTDKSLVFRAQFAAKSVLTGFFVAAVVDENRETVESAFTEPGDILVENEDDLFAPTVYTGYTTINEIRENSDSIVVILEKGAQTQ